MDDSVKEVEKGRRRRACMRFTSKTAGYSVFSRSENSIASELPSGSRMRVINIVASAAFCFGFTRSARVEQVSQHGLQNWIGFLSQGKRTSMTIGDLEDNIHI
jgi:hypothetical protein